MRKNIFFLTIFLLAAILSQPIAAQTQEVWRIGAFDGSSAEFSGGSPSQPVNFIAGKDLPEKSWYAFAPSFFPSGKTNPANAPRAIEFELGKAAGDFHLRVSLLIENPSVPALRVSVNGRNGLFYLHPKLDYNMGDTIAAFFPAYSRTAVEFDIPRGLLHSGKNSISLQAVATATEGAPDSGFAYDAIELTRAPRSEQKISAHAEPTVFYEKQGDAVLEQIAVFVRYNERPHSGELDLALAGKHYKRTLEGNQDFGEERFVIPVAEFAANSDAQIQIKWNGKTSEFSEKVSPEKKWTLFVVPHVHLDVGYTDYQPKVAAIHSRILDEAMDLVAKHPDFRFSTDGEWNLEQFLKNRSPQERQRLVEAIQRKEIYIPAQSSNVLTGFPTAETLIRSLYPSANFSRKYGTPFNYANITDVPSYTWSYASILASAGIPYFFAGSNNDRAPVLLQGQLNQNSPMFWEGPDGKKVLFWYSRHYMQMQFLFGLPPAVQIGRETLPLFFQMYQRPNYRANAAIVFGTQVENTDLFPQQAELADNWNKVFAYPRLEYSGFHDALDTIAKQFGGDLPTIRGDGGPYWEDGIGSDAFYAAMERENESRAPSAEKFATISTLVNPKLAVDQDLIHEMWANMVLMDEHTWLSGDSVYDPTSDEARNQLMVKDSRAISARDQREHLLRSSLASLADSVAAPAGNILVFNPLNWKRDGIVSMDLDNDAQLFDRATGAAVPYSVVRTGNGFRRIEFVAKDVPAVGYKTYALKSGKDAATSGNASKTSTLESSYYRVELDAASGAVRSIYDKELKKELVDTKSPYRFGQYLYVSGGDKEPNSLLQYRAVSPQPELQIHPAQNGTLLSTERTAYGWIAHMESAAENTPKIATEIRLFENEKKIEFVEDVSKKEIFTKEAIYFAFPFAMSHPQFQYEIQNGVVDPAKDMYPGAGHEWFNVQHWVSVQQEGVSGTVMPLDASLLTLGDINRGAWPTSFGERPGTIFSYAMNNYWHTNYRAAQGGDFRFRYVVTSAASTEPAALSRIGWQEFTPLELDEITSQDKALDSPRPLDGNQSSFLQVDDPDVLLETWKPAEDGNGTILRLLEFGGRSARTIKITTPLLNIDRATLTDAVERNQKPLPLTQNGGLEVEIRPHEILTIRIEKQSKTLRTTE
ncbi:MAG TPA: polysaccharide lyase family protein [Candidatus Acidoferrum sp.]|nr:polysaccharide lyase family protein [Candidatus Acidoferrum sp.]